MRFFGLSCFAASTFFALACSSPQVKPLASAELETNAKPRLEQFLRRVLVQAHQVQKPEEVELFNASLFKDGYFLESWRLAAKVGAKSIRFAFKVFPDEAHSLRNERNFAEGMTFGWPLPSEIYRGEGAPYISLPSLLMEYIEEPTLADYMRANWGEGKSVDVSKISTIYGSLGTVLGKLHRASLRKRQPTDTSGALAMRGLIERCKVDMWCGPSATKRFEQWIPVVDAKSVAFIHGDLYEAHFSVGPTGNVVKFLGMDDASYADPAMDIGTVLAQILLVHPVTRKVTCGVENPLPEESKRTAEAFLAGYKRTAGISEAEWRDFVERSKAYMYLRVGQLLTKLVENAHAKSMIELIDAKKVSLFIVDPFEKLALVY